MGVGIAFKAFFAALFDKQKATQIREVLSGQLTALPESKPKEPSKTLPAPKPPVRDPAITLLATLQREARFVDLIQEDLSQYTDAQVGAAARPCLKDCSGALDRLFGLEPVVSAAEGQTVEVGANASPMRYQWVGEGTADAGKLIHHGWQTTKVELPKWTGDKADANIVAPAQVQAS